MSFADALFLVHLSDIHFPETGGDYYDLDRNLRNEVELDLRELTEVAGGHVDAMLVTGDIARSGSEDEYIIAGEWLSKLQASLGCKPENVWVTPGNHDVNRIAVEKSAALIQLRQAVCSARDEKCASLLSELLRSGGDLFFQPLKEYNQFALRFQCNIGNDRPYWDSSLELPDGRKVLLRGMNSTLLSGTPGERDGPKSLILGEFQVPHYAPGAVQITLCHHPMSWLRDAASVGPRLDRSAAIQLFGHIHEHQVEATDSRIRLVSGAVQPPRDGHWAPGYNCLELSIPKDAKGMLAVTIYPRVWSRTEGRFVSGLASGESASYSLRLPSMPDRAPRQPKSMEEVPALIPIPRDLAFDYLSLSYVDRIAIAQRLQLLEDTDEQLADIDKFRKILLRVKARGQERDFSGLIAALLKNRRGANV